MNGLYNVKGELDCFNCRKGVSQFIHFDYNPRFGKIINSSMGIFNNYKEKLSVPRIHTAALIEF